MLLFYTKKTIKMLDDFLKYLEDKFEILGEKIF